MTFLLYTNVSVIRLLLLHFIILLFFLHLNEIWSFFQSPANKPINREKGHNERADVSAPCTEFHLK